RGATITYGETSLSQGSSSLACKPREFLLAPAQRTSLGSELRPHAHTDGSGKPSKRNRLAATNGSIGDGPSSQTHRGETSKLNGGNGVSASATEPSPTTGSSAGPQSGGKPSIRERSEESDKRKAGIRDARRASIPRGPYAHSSAALPEVKSSKFGVGDCRRGGRDRSEDDGRAARTAGRETGGRHAQRAGGRAVARSMPSPGSGRRGAVARSEDTSTAAPVDDGFNFDFSSESVEVEGRKSLRGGARPRARQTGSPPGLHLNLKGEAQGLQTGEGGGGRAWATADECKGKVKTKERPQCDASNPAEGAIAFIRESSPSLPFSFDPAPVKAASPEESSSACTKGDEGPSTGRKLLHQQHIEGLTAVTTPPTLEGVLNELGVSDECSITISGNCRVNDSGEMTGIPKGQADSGGRRNRFKLRGKRMLSPDIEDPLPRANDQEGTGSTEKEVHSALQREAASLQGGRIHQDSVKKVGGGGKWQGDRSKRDTNTDSTAKAGRTTARERLEATASGSPDASISPPQQAASVDSVTLTTTTRASTSAYAADGHSHGRAAPMLAAQGLGHVWGRALVRLSDNNKPASNLGEHRLVSRRKKGDREGTVNAQTHGVISALTAAVEVADATASTGMGLTSLIGPVASGADDAGSGHGGLQQVSTVVGMLHPAVSSSPVRTMSPLDKPLPTDHEEMEAARLGGNKRSGTQVTFCGGTTPVPTIQATESARPTKSGKRERVGDPDKEGFVEVGLVEGVQEGGAEGERGFDREQERVRDEGMEKKSRKRGVCDDDFRGGGDFGDDDVQEEWGGGWKDDDGKEESRKTEGGDHDFGDDSGDEEGGAGWKDDDGKEGSRQTEGVGDAVGEDGGH
ncbi:unnamed protein product, partial [Discosporangium mesarthrocarpum]